MQRFALVLAVLLVITPASVLGQTVQVDKEITPGTSGYSVISALGVPQYQMPKSDTASIPTIVAKSGSSGQTIATPMLSSIILGQKMIIKIDSDFVPQSGGLEKIEVQSSELAKSNGNISNEWFVVQVSDKIPQSAVPKSLSDSFLLFVDLKYPYEETGHGFNWADPANFAHPPTLTFLVPKHVPNVLTDSEGCPKTGAFLLDPSTGQWTRTLVSVLSTVSVNDKTCEIVLEAQHFSKFAVGGIRPAASTDLDGPKISSLTFSDATTDNGQNGFGAKIQGDSDNPLTNTIDVGVKTSMALRVSDDAGPDAINHIGLYTNLTSSQREIDNSDTYVLYNKDKPLRVVDPHGFFSAVDAKTSVLGRIVQLKLDFTFAKPMPKSDIIVRVGDHDNFNDYRYHDIIEAVETKGVSSQVQIPAWVKNNAKWWAEGKIDDSDFVLGTQYLIKEGIIKLPNGGVESAVATKNPTWLKNNAIWWSNDKITDSDFGFSMLYLLTTSAAS